MEFDLNDPEQALKAFEADLNGQTSELPAGGASDPGKVAAEAKDAQEAADAAAAAEAAAAAQAASTQKQGAAAGETTQDDESDAEGVLARDGKNVIPYSVLKGERERAARAEELARNAEAQIAELKAQLAAGNQGATPGESARTAGAAPEAEALSEEELEAIREDFPTMYKALRAQQATIAALQTKLQPVEQEREQRVRTEAEERAIAVRDAIDATPKLAHIQATDQKLFAAAQRFDAVLREDPDWAGKPLAERFAHVVTLIETTHGAIEIPGAKPPTAQKTPDQLKQEALAAAQATAKGTVPTSLSDFPAGSPPAQSETQALEAMSQAQLADKFARMSPDQVDAFLSNL
ncbi:hypothetical protein HTY52_12805 [Cupriavidus taiwanensis]|uniref:hypothetical protein n=1 Tax=Cupriavidus taiwanensis TaxID=164546 RepID=UPI0015717A09|nr:hypothetical protein [Cupriavidus taiwanensis]NSX14955.1 hypothetical protein [Cupriavidus taiwanensis]